MHFSCRIQFWAKKYDMLQKKNEKKNDFFRFLIKNCADQLASTANFLQLVKKISKMTFSGLVRRFEMKSHQI